MTLRDYQRDAVEKVRAAYRDGARSVVLQIGTGAGKTHTAAGGMIAPAALRGRRVVFLAHLDALITDTHARLTGAGIHAGFIQAGRPSDPTSPVQVASIATLHSRGERPPADLLVIDECHHAQSASVREILAAYPTAWLLGITATVQRGDGRALGDVFERLVCGPTNAWLTANGFLVPCDVLAPVSFSEDALADDPVDAYKKHARGTRAIVFAGSVAQAKELAERFTTAGHPAEYILGETDRDTRERLRDEVRAGTTRILVGVGVFVEGFDLPAIETVILARGFTVTGGFLQAIGRGLRPCPETGKTRCTVIDLRGSVHLHGLPDDDRVWSLDGTAVRRADVRTALRRCGECLAVFRPARTCPRCGAKAVSAPRVKKVLTRAEKLVKWNDMAPADRDARYLTRLQRVALTRMRMSSSAADAWARRRFVQQFHRAPVEAA